MEKWKIRAVELLSGLAFTGKQNPAVVPFKPQKTEVSHFEEKELIRSTPERHGISSGRIYKLIEELEHEYRVNLHNLMIIKDGEVISECSAPGYDINTAHLSHSMSKTLTGIAIGILVDEGRLSTDELLTDIFPEFPPQDKKFHQMTVYHLLTMSSGVSFSEVGSVTEDAWTKAFFSSKLTFAPGSMFAYNSMNSYILARIVVRRSGMSLSDFLTVKLFKPLGISNFFWEIGPEGIEKGGWGVFLSAESWAKVGIMMLSGGVYEGRRILSEKWVALATRPHITAPEKVGTFDYGFQLWVGKDDDDFLFSGMLGQNVWVSRKNNIIAVTNSGNNEIFHANPTVSLIGKYLGGELTDTAEIKSVSLTELREKELTFYHERSWTKPLMPKKGITYRLGLRSRTPFPKEWEGLLGTYSFPKNTQSILPLVIRVMQNNYTGGISKFIFTREGEHLFLCSVEGNDKYKFEIGFYTYKRSILDFNGEKYMIATLADTIKEENGDIHYKIEILFPEMPNSRKIRIALSSDGKVVVKMTERPNQKLAEPLIEGIYATNPKLAFAVSLLERRLGDRFLNKKLSSLFSPALIGAKVGSFDFYEIIATENRKIENEQRKTASLSAIISAFANVDPD